MADNDAFIRGNQRIREVICLSQGDDAKTPRDRAAILEARDVGRRANNQQKWLIRHVSLRICPAECLILQGPTGSGKSVLLRTLAALDALDEGSLLWHHAPIKPDIIPTFRSKVMYVPQRPAEFPGSVRQ